MTLLAVALLLAVSLSAAAAAMRALAGKGEPGRPWRARILKPRAERDPRTVPLMCGDVWENGRLTVREFHIDFGRSKARCGRAATSFWVASYEDWIGCSCNRHSDAFPVPNGRSATEQEARDLLTVHQVMHS